MFKTLLFLTLLTLSLSQVISRNNRLSQMQDQMKESVLALDTLIASGEQQMKSDLDECIENAQNLNCSNLSVWEHQRKKHSKNITNLQNKIQKHQETIEKIIALNSKETQKKQLTINALLPKIQNLKDTIEYIENIEWLIKDTYVNIEDSQQSLLHLFDIKSHQQIQSIMAELMQKQNFHDPGAKPSQKEYLPEYHEEPPKPIQQFNQGPPLIDEDIFDGHNEQYGDPKISPLFNSKSEKVLKADYIPEGVNIPEHDDNAKEIDEIIKKYIKQQEEQQVDAEEEEFDLNLDSGEKAFKENVKKIGEKLFQRLTKFRQEVQNEEDSLVQAVADLEKAIYNLHHKHAAQIVQIYMETKKLQREIFEKDDIVLALDSRINECKDMAQILKGCQENKELDEEYLENMRSQKAINEGIIKELGKLMLYEDKNVELPNIKPKEVTNEVQKVVNEIEAEKQQELNEIKEAEKEVEAEQKPEKENEPVVEPKPKEEVPVEEKPVAEEKKPAQEKKQKTEEKIPKAEEKPIEEAPAQQTAPIVEEQAPVEEAPVIEAPIEEAPVEEAPVEKTPPEEALLVKLMKEKKDREKRKNYRINKKK